MAGYPFPVTMCFFDESLAHGSLSANVDLEGVHSPLQHVVNERWNFVRRLNTSTDEWMVRRIRIHQSAAQKDSRRSIRVIPAMSGDQRLCDDFVSDITKCCYAIGKIQRQDFIARQMSTVQNVNQMHMSIDEARQQKLSASVDHAGAARN